MTSPTRSPAPAPAVAVHDRATPASRTRAAGWIAALEASPRPRLVLIAWGILVGLFTALVLFVVSPAAWPITGSRASGLRDSLALLNHGGPLLAGRHGGTGALYPVGASDDLGIYVYLPWLAHTLGIDDPVRLLRYSYVVLFALTAGFYPLIFWRLTRSMLAALVAPLIMLVCVLSFGFNDIYWVPAWGSLMLLPVLLVLSERRGRYAWVALVAIAFAAGWLNTIRHSSGVGIALAALIVLFLLRLRWWRALPVLGAMVLAYAAMGSFVIPAIRDHRDDRLGIALSAGHPQAHPFWHPAYLGLGYLPNNYGIRFLDQVAIDEVRREAPGAGYLSPRYETTLRKAYFRVARHHPFEVVGQYAAKGWVTLADTAPYLLLVILTLPALRALLVQGRLKRWLLLLAPSLVLMFLPTLLAIPLQVYEEGLYGVVGLLAILGITLTIAELSGAARSAGALRPALTTTLTAGFARSGAGKRPHPPPRAAARLIALSLLALLVLAGSGHFIRRDAEQWQRLSSSGVLIDQLPAGPTAT